jgi:hypothetical protein
MAPPGRLVEPMAVDTVSELALTTKVTGTTAGLPESPEAVIVAVPL